MAARSKQPEPRTTDSRGFTLRELADNAGVPFRTARYYLEQRLLESLGRGPAVRYPPSYVDRIRLIRRWQDEGRLLAQITAALAELSDDDVHAAVLAMPDVTAAPLLPSTWDQYDVGDSIRVMVRRPASLALNRALVRVLDELREIAGKSE